MKTQIKYEVGFRDGFSESSEWLVDEFTDALAATHYLKEVQEAGHRDIVLSTWEKEGGEWYCVDSYDEEVCVTLGFLPEPVDLIKMYIESEEPN